MPKKNRKSFAMRIKNWTRVILCLIMSWNGLTSAEVTEFRVGQVWQHLPDITVYLHIRNENGETIRNLEHTSTDAFIGSKMVPIRDIKPFDPDKEGVSYIFLVDISKSLSMAQFSATKDALYSWVKAMTPRDFAAIMTFGSTVRLLQDFTSDKGNLKNAIDTLALTDKETQLHLGLVRAMELGHRRDAKLPGRRAIIILSDGQDDFAGGMTKTDVLNRIKENPVPIYAIGFVKPPVTGAKESFLKNLGEFAHTSGGLFFKWSDTPLPAIYNQVRKSVLDIWSAELDCKEFEADGSLYRLQMNLSEGSKILTDGLDIRLLPGVSKPKQPASEENTTNKNLKLSWWKSIPVWKYYIAGGLLIIILIFLVFAFLKKKKPVLNKENSQEDQPIDTRTSVNDSQSAQPQAVPDTPISGKTVRFTKVGSNKTQVYTYKITDEFIIGRSSECHFALKEDNDISGRHCRMFMKDDLLYVQDLGSTNGTLINGVPISDIYCLRSGDLLLLGRTELRISFM